MNACVYRESRPSFPLGVSTRDRHWTSWTRVGIDGTAVINVDISFCGHQHHFSLFVCSWILVSAHGRGSTSAVLCISSVVTQKGEGFDMLRRDFFRFLFGPHFKPVLIALAPFTPVSGHTEGLRVPLSTCFFLFFSSCSLQISAHRTCAMYANQCSHRRVPLPILL